MKFAINTLAGNRTSLKQQIKTQTYNAESFYDEAKRVRNQAALNIKQAERAEANAQRACQERNKIQAQLNELDSAIAKLES